MHNVSASLDADNGAGARGGNQRVGPGVCDARVTADRTRATPRMSRKWARARRRRPSALQHCSRSHWLAEAAQLRELSTSTKSALAIDRAAPDKRFLLDQPAISSHLFCSYLSHCNLLAANSTHFPLVFLLKVCPKTLCSTTVCCVIHSHVFESHLKQAKLKTIKNSLLKSVILYTYYKYVFQSLFFCCLFHFLILLFTLF